MRSQLLMLTAEVAEATRLVLTQKLLQNLKFGVRRAPPTRPALARARCLLTPILPPSAGAGAGGVNFFGLFRKKKQSNSPRKLAPIAGSARQSRATTNDDDDRDGPDAGPDGIGPD